MHQKIRPTLNPIKDATLSFSGKIGELIKAITDHWILPLPSANPDIIGMFRRRNKKPLRNMLFFAGEFAGKYLTGSVQLYRLNRDENLKKHIAWFVNELVNAQGENGYLGIWPDDCQLTGTAPNSEGNANKTWDAWAHYHLMLGLLFWHEQSGDEEVLRAVIKIADLFCSIFLLGGKRLGSTGSEDMNLAPIHAFCLLYALTGHERYLGMAREIEKDFEVPPAGDYIRTALKGLEFYDFPVPHGRRWEGLHTVQGICEMYFITGEEKYRKVMEHIWWSIVKLDRHNTGGFSSSEAAWGTPYNKRPIENCCTIAWMALSVDMLRMTGDPKIADELELSLLNAGIGMVSPSGRWWTYNTPMEGLRKSFTEDTLEHFHGRPGTSELSCCSANGPRAIGILGDWCIMRDENALVLNYYGRCEMAAALPSGNAVRIHQETDYPVSGAVLIHVSPCRREDFAIKLRIPYWSVKTIVRINGRTVDAVHPGEYLAIKRAWQEGDMVEMELDMSLHFWRGEEECEGKSSIFRGPLLLAYDTGWNDDEKQVPPRFDAAAMGEKAVTVEDWWKPWLMLGCETMDGKVVELCDFASAGFSGYPYYTWFEVENIKKTEFSRKNPLRSSRAAV